MYNMTRSLRFSESANRRKKAPYAYAARLKNKQRCSGKSIGKPVSKGSKRGNQNMASSSMPSTKPISTSSSTQTSKLSTVSKKRIHYQSSTLHHSAEKTTRKSPNTTPLSYSPLTHMLPTAVFTAFQGEK